MSPVNAGLLLEDDTLDLRHLAARLWRYRLVIAIAPLVVATIATISATLSMGYQSSGVYRIGDYGLADYKRLRTILTDRSRFDRFARASGADTLAEGRLLRESIASEEKFNQLIQPAFRLTKEDVRQLAGSDGGKGDTLMGLRITITSDQAEKSQNGAKLLADYILDTIILTELPDWLRQEAANHKNALLKLKNRILETRFEIEQNREKLALLKELLERYPHSTDQGTRQLVSVEQGGDRYLSPLAQIVARESLIADLELSRKQLFHDSAKLTHSHRFYQAASELTHRSLGGRALLDELDLLKDDLFKPDPLDGAAEATDNELTIALAERRNRYFEKFRFLSAPQLPERASGKNRRLIAVQAWAFALAGAVLLVLLFDWWREHRDEIAAEAAVR